MKTLVVDDDFTNRMLLQEILGQYGPTHIAVNGKEAVQAVRKASAAGEPYNLICLDIMMPEMDGQETLTAIRGIEEKAGIKLGDGVKIIMTTGLGDHKNVMAAFKHACDAYLVKPIEARKLLQHLHEFNLV